ncbi:MAG: asparagine synthetase B family protein [Francisellaceae bacterium]
MSVAFIARVSFTPLHNKTVLSLKQGFVADQIFRHDSPYFTFEQKHKWTTPESVFTCLPLKNTAAQHLICGNIRLDNRLVLCQQLKLNNTVSLSDERIVLTAYERWAERCVDKLVGDFVFLIWDEVRHEFFAARDQMGMKTLYYARVGEIYYFASTMDLLLQINDLAVELNEMELAKALVFTTSDKKKTLYKGIEKLPSAHYIRLTKQKPEIRSYWSLQAVQPIYYRDRRDYHVHFLEIFNEVVASRLRVYGDVASHLSGGLDSSSVTAIAASQLKQANRSLLSFGLIHKPQTTNLANWSVDDSLLMDALVADYDNIDLIKLHLPETSFCLNLHHYHYYAEMAIRNGYNRLWMEDIIIRAQHKNIDVILTGQMGNMGFSWQGDNSRFQSRLKHAIGRYIRLVEDVFFLPQWQASSAVSPEFARAKKLVWKCFKTPLFVLKGRHSIAGLIECIGDIGQAYAPLEAHFGIEHRDPTADVRLLEFCQAIPASQFGNETEGRRLMVKKAMKGSLPDAILNRTDHGAQAANWYEIFDREQIFYRLILARLKTSPFRRFFDVENMMDALNKWQKPKREIDKIFTLCYRYKIPRAIAYYLFLSQKQAIFQRRVRRKKNKLSWSAPGLIQLF